MSFYAITAAYYVVGHAWGDARGFEPHDEGETSAERPVVRDGSSWLCITVAGPVVGGQPPVRASGFARFQHRMTRYVPVDGDPPICESRAVVAARRGAPG